MRALNITNRKISRHVHRLGRCPDLWQIGETMKDMHDSEPDVYRRSLLLTASADVIHAWHVLMALSEVVLDAQARNPEAFDELFRGDITVPKRGVK